MIRDFDACYRIVTARDVRFDGVFITGVTSTGIYCRPSCPARTPSRRNVKFFPSAAAAQAAGFRACKRCRPDASPGSPEWNIRADVVARAMRLISDGLVDREGVAGLASRLHLSERHLNRTLTAELGAGPQAIARAHRAQIARLLIETTAMAFSEIAFGAGFASIRQFNDTIRDVYAATPTELRNQKRAGSAVGHGSIVLRLPYRHPLAVEQTFAFLAARAVPGIETGSPHHFRRSLLLPHGYGIADLRTHDGYIRCELLLADVRDLGAAVQRCRRLLDLDADPEAIDGLLGADRLLAPLVYRTPGIRVAGTVDESELAIRAIVGQQISVPAARTILGRLVEMVGKPLTAPEEEVTHLFPTADDVAGADLSGLGMPAARRETLGRLCRAIAGGELVLDPGAERETARKQLVAIRGIGEWTASYVAARALRDPDSFMPSDLGVKRALKAMGVEDDPAEISLRWRPWRAYAQQHLWRSLSLTEEDGSDLLHHH